jgi:glycosyltransferase involved in cell wall biosynthesis
MRVLSIGSDREVFRRESESARRQIAYAARFESLDIVVFTRKSERRPLQVLAEGVRAYPTSSVGRLFYIFDAYRMARKLSKPDIVTAQDPFEAGFAGWLLARRWRIPLHIQVHTDLTSKTFAKHSILNRLRLMIADIVIPRAAGIRVVSRRIADSLQTANYKLQVTPSVLPIFVDVARFQHARADGVSGRFLRYRQKLLVVSRLEKEKNIQLALQAFAEGAPPDACLIIVGDGHERKALEEKAQRLGIEKRVFFEGTQNSAPYYAFADLVLAPSLYEGYGLVIVEALAAGKPVLSTDVGIAREAGAIIAEPDNFTNALREWFKEGPRTGELSRYPYENFEAYAQAYCADLEACVEGKRLQ